MNGDDYNNPLVSNFDPSWMKQGGGISGGAEYDPDLESDTSYDLIGRTYDAQTYDTSVRSRQNQAPEDFVGGSGSDCMDAAGDPPGSGTWILGSVDGTCQWIDTTTCS